MRAAPFLLKPVLKPKIWGGRDLERLFGRELAENEKIGESWELCARPGDSCLIASGELSGRTLLDAIREYPAELLGEEVLSSCGPNLPLLIKFIDAAQRLSIQVHPDDCMAEALGENDSGKEEAWYVVDARPGASLVLGTTHEMGFKELVELCRQGRYSDCLNFVQVKEGDVIAVPPGTLHAIGKGIVLYEVSQNSDITYRVNDWNRGVPGRELHTEKAGRAFVCGPPLKTVSRINRTPPQTLLHEARHFSFIEICPGSHSVLLEGDIFSTITVIKSELEIETDDTTLTLKSGDTVFIPASAGALSIKGRGCGLLTKPLIRAQQGRPKLP